MGDMPTTLNAALALLQCQLPDIKKSETAHVKTDKANYTYTYADLAQITRELLPLLGGLGLAFIAKPTLNADGKFVLAYKLLHISGEHEDGEYPLPTSGTPQAIGSAITYARRYTLVAVSGIAPEDDDDGAAAQAASEGNRGSAQRAAPQRRQPPRTAEPAPTDRPQAQRAQRATSLPALPGENEEEGITQPQMRKLHAVLREKNLADRDVALHTISMILGRTVESTKDLTKADGMTVINALEDERLPDDEPGGE